VPEPTREERASTPRRGRSRSRGEPAEVPPLEEKRYYRIGEVARITGVKPYVLRYWESEFRWMAPAKSSSKQRLYRKRDIEVIQLLKRLLYEERYTIAGARRRLRELGIDRALGVAAPELEQAADPSEGLRRIREGLLALRASL
jgi:DNA-binding transcriptional MerR regulator